MSLCPAPPLAAIAAKLFGAPMTMGKLRIMTVRCIVTDNETRFNFAGDYLKQNPR
jgi:hypothetical protein